MSQALLFKKRRRREFSGVQEGKRNYGFVANVHGPSWFWSGCALRAPSSVVSSHASQTRCLTEKRALAATSRGLEASGCWWVSRTQGGGDTILCLPHLDPHGHILSFLMVFHPLHECNRCNWTAWPSADATPQTWEVKEKAPKYTHTDGDWKKRKYKAERGKEMLAWKQADMITQIQSLRRKCCFSCCQDD